MAERSKSWWKGFLFVLHDLDGQIWLAGKSPKRRAGHGVAATYIRLDSSPGTTHDGGIGLGVSGRKSGTIYSAASCRKGVAGGRWRDQTTSLEKRLLAGFQGSSAGQSEGNTGWLWLGGSVVSARGLQQKNKPVKVWNTYAEKCKVVVARR